MMVDINVMPVFIMSVMALLLTPGPDMMLISSIAINKGRVMGLWASAGNLTSGVILTLITSMGLGEIIKEIPHAFDVMKVIGAGYLFYLAWCGWRGEQIKKEIVDNKKEAWSCYKAAVVNNLMNPKALLFFMMFLPQFVSTGMMSSPKEQLLLLGLILNSMGFLFNFVLVTSMSKFVESWIGNKVNTRYQKKIISMVFACLGGWMIIELVR